jgi:serine/threonine protein kinase
MARFYIGSTSSPIIRSKTESFKLPRQIESLDDEIMRNNFNTYDNFLENGFIDVLKFPDGSTYPFNYSHLVPLKIISHISHEVRLFLHSPSSKIFVGKIIKLANPYDKKIERELKIFHELRGCKNIVEYYGSGVISPQEENDPKKLIIFMELMEKSLAVSTFQ